MTAATATSAGSLNGRGPLQQLLGTPRWVFHAVVGTACAWLLWSLGLPGFAFFTVMPLLLFLAAAAALWFVKLAAFAVRARRGAFDRRVAAWFLVAPVAGLVALALLWTNTPLKVRWAMSRDDFARVVAASPAVSGDETQDIDVPKVIGAYRVLGAYRKGEAVIFMDPVGSMFDDAGFAYLPSGPTAAVKAGFESPHFEHIEGPWYMWTSSW